MNCLRCGREIDEKQSFCDSCSKTVSEPLRESPYLSTRVVLPTRRTPGAKAPPSRSSRRSERKSAERHGESDSRRGLSALSVMCFFLAGVTVLLSLFFLRTREAYSNLQEEAALLQEENGTLLEHLEKIDGSYVLADPTEPRRYHSFTCREAGSNCLILQPFVAARQGYIPCPVCQGGQTDEN